MLKTITWFTFCALFFSSILFAQNKVAQHSVITGEEVISHTVYSDINPHNVVISDRIINGSLFQFEMHAITGLMTGYDLMSNSSPQQLWYDMTSSSLNAAFTTSQQEGGWSDRTCTYFYSEDAGVTWTNVGNVPDPASATSGFPAISGFSFGSVVIANHTGLGGAPTRTQLFVNSEAGVYDFVNFDPGPTANGGAIWPRTTVSANDIVAVGSSISGGTDAWVNTFDINAGTFSGWDLNVGSDQAETYPMASSVGGKVGHAYLDPLGGAWFRESTDDGATWSTPVQIFEPFLEVVDPDTFLHGTIRGITVAYVGENARVAFDVVLQSPDLAGFFPGLPSDIYLWGPDLNGGDRFRIVDGENDVPFFPNQGIVADGFTSVCRPVLGKSDGDAGLFMGFVAAGPDTATTADGSRFYDGYFMVSLDGGATWTAPEKFTPASTPPMDWRFVSIAQVNPVDNNTATVHMVIVADPTAASQVNGAPAGVTARFYHFSTEVELSEVSAGNEFIADNFELIQNYPNPFNPSTLIKYNLAERSNVMLKVYDVLGKEVATLVNTTKDAGSHEVKFDASELSSGLYIYTLQAGNFTSSKKMMLLK